MKGFAERYREEGMQKGMQEVMQKAEVLVLVRQLRSKFGDLPEGIRDRIEQADSDTLLRWLDRVLTANDINEVIH